MKSEVSEAQEHRRPVTRCRVCLKEIRAGEDHSTVPYRGSQYVVCCPLCAIKFRTSPREHVVEA